MNRIDAIKQQNYDEQHRDATGTRLVRSPASYDIPGDMEKSRRKQSCAFRIWSAVKNHFASNSG